MMILTSIIILTAIYSQFTFDSKISRIKATNILDRSQAKLLAESGLQLAITRLRLYKEAYNKVQSSPEAKKLVTPQLLNQLWEVPFMFPIPVGKNVSQVFKETVAKFEKESMLDGTMKVSIQNISSRLNLNLLRVDVTKLKTDDQGNVVPPETTSIFAQGNEKSDEISFDQTLYLLLKRLVDEKKEKDEGFADRYGNLNYQELFTNLKYYMSDFQTMASDPLAGEAEATFQKVPLTPKYGPLGSASELYGIPAWNDELVELIKNEFSVYPTTLIDLNKITANMLKLFFPIMTDDDVKAFFLYRDDPETPKQMNSVEDLKRYIVTEARLIAEEDFNKRMAAFQKSGISFGANPNLFKIVSEGEYNRAAYTLVAYVVLPPEEVTAPVKPPPKPGEEPVPDTEKEKPDPKQNAQLLEPRIIEIQVN